VAENISTGSIRSGFITSHELNHSVVNSLLEQIAIYVPTGLDEPNGIRYLADVEYVESDRGEILTPWAGRKNGR
jgi:hypothetical protein